MKLNTSRYYFDLINFKKIGIKKTHSPWFVAKILCASLSLLAILCLHSCSQFQPEFETSACQFNDEHRSVLIQVNLVDSTFYSYENHLWRPINDHEGQDTHCSLMGTQMTLKSCWLLYCTDQVRICNNRICETTEAQTLPYCNDYSQITFQIKDDWQHFTIIIPIQ